MRTRSLRHARNEDGSRSRAAGVRFLNALETYETELLAQGSGSPIRRLQDQPDSEWEMQMLVMAIVPEMTSSLRWETAKDSA